MQSSRLCFTPQSRRRICALLVAVVLAGILAALVNSVLRFGAAQRANSCVEVPDAASFRKVHFLSPRAGASRADDDDGIAQNSEQYAHDERAEYRDGPFGLYQIIPANEPTSQRLEGRSGEVQAAVLFVHGHRGNKDQASALATALRSYLLDQKAKTKITPGTSTSHTASGRSATDGSPTKAIIDVAFYTVDFAEASSAFHAGLLQSEAEFVAHALDLLAKGSDGGGPPPVSVVVVGHSMGGLAARLGVRKYQRKLKRRKHESVGAAAAVGDNGNDESAPVLLITLNSPHQRHPYYGGGDPELSDVHSSGHDGNDDGDDGAIISITGGASDLTIPSELTPLSSPDVIRTQSAPGSWAAASHDGIVNCGQFVSALARAVGDAVLSLPLPPSARQQAPAAAALSQRVRASLMPPYSNFLLQTDMPALKSASTQSQAQPLKRAHTLLQPGDCASLQAADLSGDALIIRLVRRDNDVGDEAPPYLLYLRPAPASSQQRGDDKGIAEAVYLKPEQASPHRVHYNYSRAQLPDWYLRTHMHASAAAGRYRFALPAATQDAAGYGGVPSSPHFHSQESFPYLSQAGSLTVHQWRLDAGAVKQHFQVCLATSSSNAHKRAAGDNEPKNGALNSAKQSLLDRPDDAIRSGVNGFAFAEVLAPTLTASSFSAAREASQIVQSLDLCALFEVSAVSSLFYSRVDGYAGPRAHLRGKLPPRGTSPGDSSDSKARPDTPVPSFCWPSPYLRYRLDVVAIPIDVTPAALNARNSPAFAPVLSLHAPSTSPAEAGNTALMLLPSFTTADRDTQVPSAAGDITQPPYRYRFHYDLDVDSLLVQAGEKDGRTRPAFVSLLADPSFRYEVSIRPAPSWATEPASTSAVISRLSALVGVWGIYSIKWMIKHTTWPLLALQCIAVAVLGRVALRFSGDPGAGVLPIRPMPALVSLAPSLTATVLLVIAPLLALVNGPLVSTLNANGTAPAVRASSTALAFKAPGYADVVISFVMAGSIAFLVGLLVEAAWWVSGLVRARQCGHCLDITSTAAIPAAASLAEGKQAISRPHLPASSAMAAGALLRRSSSAPVLSAHFAGGSAANFDENASDPRHQSFGIGTSISPTARGAGSGSVLRVTSKAGHNPAPSPTALVAGVGIQREGEPRAESPALIGGFGPRTAGSNIGRGHVVSPLHARADGADARRVVHLTEPPLAAAVPVTACLLRFLASLYAGDEACGAAAKIGPVDDIRLSKPPEDPTPEPLHASWVQRVAAGLFVALCTALVLAHFSAPWASTFAAYVITIVVLLALSPSGPAVGWYCSAWLLALAPTFGFRAMSLIHSAERLFFRRSLRSPLSSSPHSGPEQSAVPGPGVFGALLDAHPYHGDAIVLLPILLLLLALVFLLAFDRLQCFSRGGHNPFVSRALLDYKLLARGPTCRVASIVTAFAGIALFVGACPPAAAHSLANSHQHYSGLALVTPMVAVLALVHLLLLPPSLTPPNANIAPPLS